MAKKPKKAGKKAGSFQGRLIIVICLIAAIIFLPTTVFVAVAMLPTLVVFLTDRDNGVIKGLTVGSINLAGATPFLFELWMKGHDFDRALNLLANPSTIVVIYGAAAVGYMINWSLSGIVSSVIIQRAKARLREIEKRQEALIARWGEKVKGDVALDKQGFPLHVAGE